MKYLLLILMAVMMTTSCTKDSFSEGEEEEYEYGEDDELLIESSTCPARAGIYEGYFDTDVGNFGGTATIEVLSLANNIQINFTFQVPILDENGNVVTPLFGNINLSLVSNCNTFDFLITDPLPFGPYSITDFSGAFINGGGSVPTEIIANFGLYITSEGGNGINEPSERFDVYGDKVN